MCVYVCVCMCVCVCVCVCVCDVYRRMCVSKSVVNYSRDPYILHCCPSLSSSLQWMSGGMTRANQYEQAELGKTEVSLINFAVSSNQV